MVVPIAVFRFLFSICLEFFTMFRSQTSIILLLMLLMTCYSLKCVNSISKFFIFIGELKCCIIKNRYYEQNCIQCIFIIHIMYPWDCPTSFPKETISFEGFFNTKLAFIAVDGVRRKKRPVVWLTDCTNSINSRQKQCGTLH